VQGDFDDFEAPEQLVGGFFCVDGPRGLGVVIRAVVWCESSLAAANVEQQHQQQLYALPPNAPNQTAHSQSNNIPLTPKNLKVVEIGDLRVGICHGHQVVPWGDKEALAILQRQLDVDILVTGHTHAFEVGRGVGRCGCSDCRRRRRRSWRSIQSNQPIQRTSPNPTPTQPKPTPPPPKAVMYGERLQINPGSATGAYSSLTPDVKPSFVLMDVDGPKVGGRGGEYRVDRMSQALTH
jgi:predicted phosphodiesterase